MAGRLCVRPLSGTSVEAHCARACSAPIDATAAQRAVAAWLAVQAKTRQFMFDHVRRGLVEPYGLSHWWLDCDEP
jgi:hypothetical protein